MSGEPGKQMTFDLSDSANDGMEFPIDPKGRGYHEFAQTREQAIERVNQRFGAMIGECVRLNFLGFDDELKGKLMLNTLLLPKSRKDEVPLRIGHATFDLRDVEHCIRL